jgi:cytochrome c-type biogenesis protein
LTRALGLTWQRGAKIEQNFGTRAREMLTQVYIHLGVALAGLVSFLSPCVLPLVPPYLGYLSGTTIEQMTDEAGIADHLWRRVVLASLLFVLGFTAVFVALGAGASALGQWVQAHKSGLAIIAGTVIIGFGLHFLGLLRVPLLYRQARFQARTEGASLVGAFVMGLAFAFGWTPCIGPVLATVLTLAANEGSLGAGVRLLLVYSLGLGVPFVLAAAAIGPFIAFLQRFRRHLRHVEMVMGVLLVLTGVLMLTGSLNWFGQWLIDNVPFLARIEEAVTPERLQTEILKEGAR